MPEYPNVSVSVLKFENMVGCVSNTVIMVESPDAVMNPFSLVGSCDIEPEVYFHCSPAVKLLMLIQHLYKMMYNEQLIDLMHHM